MIEELETLRKRTEEHNNRHRRNAMPSSFKTRPSLTHQYSRDDSSKPSPQIKRRYMRIKTNGFGERTVA